MEARIGFKRKAGGPPPSWAGQAPDQKNWILLLFSRKFSPERLLLIEAGVTAFRALGLRPALRRECPSGTFVTQKGGPLGPWLYCAFSDKMEPHGAKLPGEEALVRFFGLDA